MKVPGIFFSRPFLSLAIFSATIRDSHPIELFLHEPWVGHKKLKPSAKSMKGNKKARLAEKSPRMYGY
jgi:hypothetical protein